MLSVLAYYSLKWQVRTTKLVGRGVWRVLYIILHISSQVLMHLYYTYTDKQMMCTYGSLYVHYCKSLFKHGQRVATMKNWLLRLGWWHQQRIDGGYNVNCMFFSMHGVSKMLEWSIIRVRWANRRLGQYAGEWSSCERFFLIFLGCCGCKGSRQRSAATRGCGGTEHAFFHPWEKLLFFCLDRQCEVLHFDVKHCWVTVKSVSTIKDES